MPGNQQKLELDIEQMRLAVELMVETEPCHSKERFEMALLNLGMGLKETPIEDFVLCRKVSEFLGRPNIGQAIRFYGNIRSMSSPHPLQIEKSSIRSFDVVDIELVDRSEGVIAAIPVTIGDLSKRIERVFKSYSSFCFYGILTYSLRKRNRVGNIKQHDMDFRFLLFDVKPAENLSEIVDLDQNEVDNARTLIKRQSAKHNGILNYIRNNIITEIKLKGLNYSSLLDMALQYIILQSLSDYTLNKKSAKLHSLIIGAPAVGKGKLLDAIKMLNPIYRDAQATRLTLAGLTGATYFLGGVRHSDPGLISMAHRGVFFIQDFHNAKNKYAIYGILSEVMEDGVAKESTRAKQTHQALTAIHLDMNKLPDIYYDDPTKYSKSKYKELKKIGVPLPILSRFDLVVDIVQDPERQKKIALEILGESSSTEDVSLLVDAQIPPSTVGTIATILKVDYPRINISQDMASYMKDEFDNLVGDVSSEPLLSDFLTRMSKSFKKLAVAVARGNARNDVTKDDVNYALGFIKLKLDFLDRVKPQIVATTSQSTTTGPTITPSKRSDKAIEMIKANFGGKEITLDEAKSFLDSALKYQYHPDHIRRLLDKKFDKIKSGTWQIEK